ncbi:hypothetical protein P3T76_011994 [Phytophthora citrophthora]|uniref:RING-type domain-containing protein n=1 Tax=Phytophthora citrophthora TaxID=4793 RepID=A0AAD9G5W0_9STRA|nr:hypothetical protein P3T76_011994 [Phytophthora citrophthora]
MPRKSFTSATVVPTATPDQCDDLTDNAEEQQAEALSPPDTRENIQTDKTIAETTDSMPNVVKRGGSQRQLSPSKPPPLPISQSLTMNVEVTDRGTFKRVNNYKALASSFRQLMPYARRPDGTYPPSITCIMCSKGKPTSVFFPCQHMCVCSACIESNDMSPDCSMHLERCVCPVCSTDIGIILPHSGTEEDDYWRWVLSTKQSLPAQFLRDFKTAGEKIGDRSIEKDDPPSRRSSDTCKAKKEFAKISRRKSWSARSRRESPYELGDDKQREHCLIL